jgi:hypothetical protein
MQSGMLFSMISPVLCVEYCCQRRIQRVTKPKTFNDAPTTSISNNHKRDAIKDAQKIVLQATQGKKNLVDELTKQRRAESKENK